MCSSQSPPLFNIDEESFGDSLESQTKDNQELHFVIPVLSVNQFLESVCQQLQALIYLKWLKLEISMVAYSYHISSNQVLETTHQVGRISISTTADVPFKEMAHHCELLLMGKQQKMSSLMTSHQKQETVMFVSLQNQENEVNLRGI